MNRRSRAAVLPAAGVVGLLAVLIVFGPLFAPHSPTEAHGIPFAPPSAHHLLGTDFVGRDVLSRVLHGGYRLVALASIALAVSYLLGVPVGLTAGLRRRMDGWLMRPVDTLIVLPWFLVVAVMATAVGKGPVAIALATAIITAPWVARIVRTATIEILSTGYVEAARTRGESDVQIAVHQILPNLRPVLIADAGIRLSATVGVVTASSFLGLGTHQPAPDWALMVTENRAGMGAAPLAVLVPAVLITVLVVSLNLFADRLAAPAERRGNGHVPQRVPTIVEESDDPPGLHVVGLTVLDQEGRTILDDIDLSVPAGRSIALVGPSGAGKTTLALAMLGALAPDLLQRGAVRVPRSVGYVPQDPATALNPALRIETAFREMQRAHGIPGTEAIISALRSVDLPTDRSFRRRYPHQLSGGQQQRVLVALAMMHRPEVIVLDEPTTGLDTHAATVLVETLRRLRDATGSSFLVITHDLAALDGLVDEVVLVRDGRISRDQSSPPRIAAPHRPSPVALDEVLLTQDLVAGHPGTVALERVTFGVRAGECVALVGSSGSGKTTLARCLVGLHQPESGRVLLGGSDLAPLAANRTPAQRRAIQLVFQNPRRSLNPRASVAKELTRPLRLLRTMSRDEADREAGALLRRVGLGPEVLPRTSLTLSGGQAQRVALARALAAGPRLLVCDEITSSLDPESRDRILEVLACVAADGVGVLFISHDMSAVERLGDRVIRLSAGSLDGDLRERAGRDVAPG